MAPPDLRRSTPCRPAAGSFNGANNSSSVAIFRPLTKATAPPRRSATSRKSDFISGSAAVCEGVSVSSTNVPSTSKNKHQSSAGGGGAGVMWQKHSLRHGCCQWLARIYLKCKFYTKFVAQNSRRCSQSSVFCIYRQGVLFEYTETRCFARSCCDSSCRSHLLLAW